MNEYFNSCADSPDYNSVWAIREQNTTVIMFYHVPKGFKSRNLVGCICRDDKIRLDPRCLIHHLPGNYVKDKKRLADFSRVDELVVP